MPGGARVGIAGVWAMFAVGAATVLVIGHAETMRVCGRGPVVVWARGLRTVARSARAVLTGPVGRLLGPSVARPDVVGPLPRVGTVVR